MKIIHKNNFIFVYFKNIMCTFWASNCRRSFCHRANFHEMFLGIRLSSNQCRLLGPPYHCPWYRRTRPDPCRSCHLL